MLRTVLALVALAVVFVVAWLALRRARPEQPAISSGDDAYMRNIRAATGDFGSRPHEPAEMDPMKTPIFPPPQTRD